MSKNQNETASAVKKDFQKRLLKNGTVSALLAFAAIAVVVLVNVLASKLPTNVKDINLSGSLIYEVGDQSTEVLTNLSEDVKIYVVGEEDEIDSRIRRFLDKYVSKSSKVTLEYVDPVVSPAFLSKHGLTEGSLLVRCEAMNKEKVISFSDIIVKQLDYYSYYYYGKTEYTETEFDGEGQLTNAVLLVTNPKTYKGYILGGHEMTVKNANDETAVISLVGDTLKTSVAEFGVTLEDWNLITQGSIPADADFLILNSPGSDLTEEEVKELKAYMEQGGRIILYSAFNSNPDTNQPVDLERLYEFTENYGIEIHNTYLGDLTYGSYTTAYGGSQQDPYTLTMRANGDDTIISKLSAQYMLLYLPQGLTMVPDLRSSVKVTSLVESSTKAYLYPTEFFGKDTEDISFDPADYYGKYYMGLKAVETVNGKESRLIVMTGNYGLDDVLFKSYPGNLELAKQLIVDCLGDSSVSVSIPAKSLQEESNTFSTADQKSVIVAIGAAVIAIVIPLVLLIIGLVILIRRRRR